MPRAPLPADLREAIDEFVRLRQLVAAEPPPALAAMLAAAPRATFRDELLGMIRSRGLVDSRVCAAAGVDRRHYSKIRNDPECRPDKATVISFAIALRLSFAESERLMRAAGHAFSDASLFDLICRFFLENGEHDPFRINDALHAYGQPLVCGVTE